MGTSRRNQQIARHARVKIEVGSTDNSPELNSERSPKIMSSSSSESFETSEGSEPFHASYLPKVPSGIQVQNGSGVPGGPRNDSPTPPPSLLGGMTPADYGLAKNDFEKSSDIERDFKGSYNAAKGDAPNRCSKCCVTVKIVIQCDTMGAEAAPIIAGKTMHMSAPRRPGVDYNDR